jgi:hypothetical protein
MTLITGHNRSETLLGIETAIVRSEHLRQLVPSQQVRNPFRD